MNGRIAHGFEYKNPALRSVPTSYYSPESGIGLVLSNRPGERPRRVGLVGLGIGTLATYARPGDQFQFYEINPMVERLAREYFHYLSDCRGKVDIIHGDARLTLDREPPQKFDVLVLDAFSGDAIPVHLLTVEAFAIYLRHLAPEGIIAVHISNRHFDLRPVVEAIAAHDHLATAAIHSDETSYGGFSSLWVLVTPDRKLLEAGRDQPGGPCRGRPSRSLDRRPCVPGRRPVAKRASRRSGQRPANRFPSCNNELFGARKTGRPSNGRPVAN